MNVVQKTGSILVTIAWIGVGVIIGMMICGASGHAQVVATQPVVSGCNATGGVTVCTMTDTATQRAWLIVYTSAGVSVVEDDLRR